VRNPAFTPQLSGFELHALQIAADQIDLQVIASQPRGACPAQPPGRGERGNGGVAAELLSCPTKTRAAASRQRSGQCPGSVLTSGAVRKTPAQHWPVPRSKSACLYRK
jgi:hypothetical protein